MIYARHCNDCDHDFDVNCRLADRDTPKACPNCMSKNGVYRPTAPQCVSMEGNRFTAVSSRPSGFNEVISKIKERNPRTEICQR